MSDEKYAGDKEAFEEHEDLFPIRKIASVVKLPPRVAKSCTHLRSQVDKKYPNRSTKSDGTYGNKAHCPNQDGTGKSDHCPNIEDSGKAVVTAIDITHDPKNGCDIGEIVKAIANDKDHRVKYIIWNKQICSSKIQPWVWRPYSGVNPHTKHAHISVLPDKNNYDDDESDWKIS